MSARPRPTGVMRRAQVSRRRRRRVPGGRSRTPSRGPLITCATQPHGRCLPCRLGDFLPRSPTYSMHNFNELHRAGAQFTQSGGLSGVRMRHIPDPAHDQTAVDSHRRPGYTGGAVTSIAGRPDGRGLIDARLSRQVHAASPSTCRPRLAANSPPTWPTRRGT
jgi:hypothetical protein